MASAAPTVLNSSPERHEGDHAIHPVQVSQKKKQLQDGASELLTPGETRNDNEQCQVEEAEQYQQIGKLQMKLE